MGIIKLLPPHEAQKIAAGEVIDRPANIVKELIENSLDAGSTHIILSVEDGGKKSICVEDNGHGMSAEDAKNSILRHATSKINTIDDLEHTTSFGFRGEALASITSIAKTTMITKQAADIEAIKLTIQEGTIKNEEPCAAPNGTKIIIEDLFYTIPARKKFLRTSATENRVISQLFHAFALSNPTCQFTLLSDGRKIYTCGPVKKIQERLRHLSMAIHEHDLRSIPEATHHGITIHGIVSHHHVTRHDRNQIYIFVNNRWVKNYKLVNAVIKGYQEVLPKGKYPIAIVFVSLDPREVDINIHPRKEEVAFLHPRRVEQHITQCTQQALESLLKSTPKQLAPFTFTDSFLQYHTPFHTKKNTFPVPSQNQSDYKSLDPQQESDKEIFITPEPTSVARETPQQQNQHQGFNNNPKQARLTPQERDYRLIGVLSYTYILIEREQQLIIIDAHAAHERILFEQFGKNFDKQESVGLLFPYILDMAQHDIQELEPYYDLLEKYGIIVESFGANKIMISGTPAGLQEIDYVDFLRTILSWIHDKEAVDAKELKESLCNNIQAMMACKAAVKAGDHLTTEKMHEIIDALYICNNKLTCPHGRPTSWVIDHKEVEKKFKRT